MYLFPLLAGMGRISAVPNFSSAAGEFLKPYPLQHMEKLQYFGVTNEALWMWSGLMGAHAANVLRTRLGDAVDASRVQSPTPHTCCDTLFSHRHQV